VKRTIQDVRDLRTGLEFTSDELLVKFENDPRERTIIRRELYEASKEGVEKKLVCSICNQPLKLCGGKVKTKQKLHFRHYQDSNDCPIKTSEKLSQPEIDCMRYNGAKESERHKQLKEFIYNRLLQDDRFKESAMEKVVKILNERKSWRKPDVSAVFEDKKIVFEIQLQTTFLNVIKDREDDYKNEHTFIMWFFDNNNMEKFRFSEEDIFYANNSNAYVITDKTIELSTQQNKFLFECYYKKPYIKDNKIVEIWSNQIISFDDLKFDNINYKVYYYDFDKEKKQLEELLLNSTNTQIVLNKRFDFDKEIFFKNLDENSKILDNDLSILCQEYNVDKQNESEIRPVIYILYSIKKQKVFHWELNMIGALNNFFYHHDEYAFLVIKMIKKYKLRDWILELDKKNLL